MADCPDEITEDTISWRLSAVLPIHACKPFPVLLRLVASVINLDQFNAVVFFVISVDNPDARLYAFTSECTAGELLGLVDLWFLDCETTGEQENASRVLPQLMV